MRKLIFGALVAILAFAMIGCPGDGGTEGPTKYTVSYNANGGTGTVPSSQTVESGKTVTIAQGTGLSKLGFTFDGWNTNATGSGTNYAAGAVVTPASNLTLFAKWAEVQTWAIQFTMGANYDGTEAPPATIVVPRETPAKNLQQLGISLPTPGGTSQDFGGWFIYDGVTNSTEFKVDTAIDKDFSLIAMWDNEVEAEEITISFDLGDYDGPVAAPADVKILKGTALESKLPTVAELPYWKKHLFAGWSLTGVSTPITAAYLFTADAELVAQWSDDPRPVITFTAYDDAIPEYIIVIAGQSFDNLGLTFPTPDQKPATTGYNWYFAGWKDENNNAVTSGSSFQEDAEVTGVWWNNFFGTLDTSGAEKVQVRDGAFVIYEFDLATALSKSTVTIDDLADITEISLQQAINEVAFNSMSVRGMRVYGPYAYNDDIVVNTSTWSTGDILHGDFKHTAEGMVIAKMNGDDGVYTVESTRRFNKFHPYMAYNNANRFGFNQPGESGTGGWSTLPASVTEITFAAGQTGIAPNTYFNVKYPLNGTITATADATNLSSTIARIKAAGTDVLPPSTNYNKVYFAIGPSTETPTSKITYLMKDVNLKIGSVTVPGAKPNFGTGFDAANNTGIGFACYEASSRYSNWRGAPDAVIEDREASGTDTKFDADYIDALHTDAVNDGYFYVRLWDFDTPPSFQTNGSATPSIGLASAFTGDFTKGPLTVIFPAEQAMLAIALTPYQTEILKNSKVDITVTLVGTSTNNNNYRFALGDTTKSGDWQCTSLPAEAFNTLFFDEDDPTAPAVIDVTGNARWGDGEAKYFMLQNRSSGTDTVVIDSIKIAYSFDPPPPPEPPTPADADLPIITSANTMTLTKSFSANGYAQIEIPLDGSTTGNAADIVWLSGTGPTVSLPTDLVLGSYSSYTLKITAYDGDGTEVTGNLIQFAFVKDTSQYWNNRIGNFDDNIVTDAGFVEHAWRTSEVYGEPLAGICAQNIAAFEKLVITELTLHK